MEAASKPASPITHAARAAIPSSRRMHANARSRHGNGIYSRPTTLNSRPNHRRRTSHTTSTITIIVPNKPKPNIAPPSGHIGHQGYPCRHDRPGFRLSSDQNQPISRIIETGSVICAISDSLCLHYRLTGSYYLLTAQHVSGVLRTPGVALACSHRSSLRRGEGFGKAWVCPGRPLRLAKRPPIDGAPNEERGL